MSVENELIFATIQVITIPLTAIDNQDVLLILIIIN